MSLVSGEGVPEVDVIKVVSEVQEWLQSQPDDLNSHIPLRTALDSLQRYRALQHENEREKAKYHRLRDLLRNSILTTDPQKLSQLHSQLQNSGDFKPQYLNSSVEDFVWMTDLF